MRLLRYGGKQKPSSLPCDARAWGIIYGSQSGRSVGDSDFLAAFVDVLFPLAPPLVHHEENAIRACSSQRVVRNGPFVLCR